MGKTNENDIVAYLDQLYSAQRDQLGDFPWEDEADRWHELIICIWIGALNIDAGQARDGMRRLVDVGLGSALHLSQLDPSSRYVYKSALMMSGMTEELASAAIQIAEHTGKEVARDCSAGIHILLRQAGEHLVTKMAAFLEGGGLTPIKARKASILWLQNVANIPLLLVEDEHIANLCKHFEISPAELVDICDQLQLNVAVLDDLLKAQHLTTEYLADYMTVSNRDAGVEMDEGKNISI